MGTPLQIKARGEVDLSEVYSSLLDDPSVSIIDQPGGEYLVVAESDDFRLIARVEGSLLFGVPVGTATVSSVRVTDETGTILSASDPAGLELDPLAILAGGIDALVAAATDHYDFSIVGNGKANVIGGLDIGDDINGRGGNDTLSGNGGDDTILGAGGHDVISGDAGNDKLTGAGGNDNINGGEGDDRLMAGRGEDTLTGGDGEDAFVFTTNSGDNVITDFEDADSIVARWISSYDEVTSSESVDGNLVLSFGNASVELEGVSSNTEVADILVI